MFWRLSALFAAILILGLGAALYTSEAPAEKDPDSLRNLGRSFYEEEKYEEALGIFERILSLTPNSAIDEINLGIVLVQMERYEEARKHLARGESLDPKLAPHAAYNLALSYKRERDFAPAIKEFERMRTLDPNCPDTAYNLAVVYESSGDLAKAFDEATRAVNLLPDQIAPRYRRMMLAVRLGKLDVANQEKQATAELRAQDARNRTPAELEKSVYTEIVEPDRSAAPRAVSVAEPAAVKFEQQKLACVSSAVKPPKESLATATLSWVDLDGDGVQDLVLVDAGRKPSFHWWRNSGRGRFELQAVPEGIPADGLTGAWWGDLDHDADQDLVAVQGQRIRVLLNEGGKFAPSPEAMPYDKGTPADLLLIDYDHDGDLDLFVAPQTAAPVMYRNDGKGGFAAVSGETGLAGDGKPAAALLALDFDDDNDTDFLLWRPDGPQQLLSNLRLGRFQDVAPRLGADQLGRSRAGFVTYLNSDVWPDLVFSQEGGEVVALLGTRIGRLERRVLARATGGAPCLTAFDYDNDGDEDLLAGGALLQNDGEFHDVTQAVGLGSLASSSPRRISLEDFDRDGDTDLAVLGAEGVSVWRNQGGNRNHWLRVNLEGLQSNRFGVATKAEVRAGSFFQRKICQGRPLLFGVGPRTEVDTLRLWWPTGVAQNVLNPVVSQTTEVREKLGPPSSCPFVYVWDGRRFAFLTDVLDTAAIGVPLGAGGFLPHADKEDVLIPGARAALKDGRIVLQLTGELRELVYLDKADLRAVDHVAGSSVFPLDFGGLPASRESRLAEVRDLRPPVSVVDETARDLTQSVLKSDSEYAGGFGLTRFNGLARTHELVADLGDLSSLRRPALLLSGWINWIDGDTLYALGQGAGPAPFGPLLEVQTTPGQWEKVTDNTGVPAGIDKNVIVRLPVQRGAGRTLVRLTTNLEVYWNRIAAGEWLAVSDREEHRLALSSADLHFRGFSRMVRNSEETPPWYDYETVAVEMPWKPQQGFLTRFGDVRSLLAEGDDRLVILGPGDELTLSFTAPPALFAGAERDYVLRLEGWIKDANPSTYAGDRVEPLPRRSMRSYPFGAEQTPMADLSYWNYLREYGTRVLARTSHRVSTPPAVE